MPHAELVKATTASGVGSQILSTPILSIIIGAYILLLAWEEKGWNKGRGIGGVDRMIMLQVARLARVVKSKSLLCGVGGQILSTPILSIILTYSCWHGGRRGGIKGGE